MTPRDHAAQAARLAAYGSLLAKTPADYTLLEALHAMTREVIKERKKKQSDAPIEDVAMGPIFDGEGSDE